MTTKKEKEKAQGTAAVGAAVARQQTINGFDFLFDVRKRLVKPLPPLPLHGLQLLGRRLVLLIGRVKRLEQATQHHQFR
jgi:hypothetical protein